MNTGRAVRSKEISEALEEGAVVYCCLSHSTNTGN